MNRTPITEIAAAIIVAVLFTLSGSVALQLRVAPTLHTAAPVELSTPPSKSPAPTMAATTPTAASMPTPTVTQPEDVSSAPAPAPSLMAGCMRTDGLSAPVYLEPEGLGRRGVQALPPVNGVSPDPLNFNPDVFAWDNMSGELGLDEYKALFTAHTYSHRDTALGNQLQAHLHPGHTIRATSATGQVICYEVIERLEVSELEYRGAIGTRSGEGLLVIIVCSGLEGKEWTTRTIWFAQMLS